MKKKKLNAKENFLKIFNAQELRILPGSIAFSFVMAIVPTLLLGILVCTKCNISIPGIMDLLDEIIPNDVSNLLHPIVSSGLKNIDISIWYILLGLLLASNGTDAIILASNTLYHVENENYLARRIKALLMIIVVGFVFAFLLIVIAFGNNILKFILSLSALQNIKDDIFSLFLLLKWPVAILIIAILVKVIYTIAPNKKIPSKFVNKGVLFTTIGWVITTAIYSFYTNNIAHYDLFYGSLSSLIVLMLWIYVISYILVIGIAINANLYELEEENSS